MIPDPLHPAIVHFPIVLMFLAPLAAIIALWSIRRGADIRRSWLMAVVAALALALSTWAATLSGQDQEERVERVVAEQPIETHEESAELFFMLSGVLVVLSVAGLARGSLGRGSRILATLWAVALIPAGVRVGHSGGQLVYRHGAANAYTQPTVQPSGEAAGEVRGR